MANSATIIKINADHSVTVNGEKVSYADAHKLITDARTADREIRKEKTASKRTEKRAARAQRLLDRKAKLEEQLAALNAA